MSNLIKSGFVTLAQDNTLIIDANKHKIITDVEETLRHEESTLEDSVEDALAEAMLHDAGLNDAELDENVLTMNTEDIPNTSSNSKEELKHVVDGVMKSAKEEADEIVNKAYDEAEQLRASAYDEAELIKKEAKEEGYQMGYSEGLEAANMEFAEKEAKLKQYEEDIQVKFDKQKDDLLIQTENNMVAFLCQIFPKITGILIDDYQSVLLYLINSAMKDLDNSKNFVIKVSSLDYPKIVQQKDSIYGSMNPNIDLEIFEDAKLSESQCLIETDNGIVDVSLDVQVDNLIKTLKLMKKE